MALYIGKLTIKVRTAFGIVATFKFGYLLSSKSPKLIEQIKQEALSDLEKKTKEVAPNVVVNYKAKMELQVYDRFITSYFSEPKKK